MFYLASFFKTLLSKPVIAFSWLLGCVLILVNLFTPIEHKTKVLGLGIEAKKELPHFFALMPDKINSEYVRRKLVELPGVEKVHIVSKVKIADQVKSIVSQASLDVIDDLKELNYAGLKVEFAPTLKARSEELIRSYLKRIAGSDEVTLSGVQRPKTTDLLRPKISNDSVDFIITSIGTLLYILSLMFILKPLAKDSFIIESYQRKKNVFSKSLLYANAPIIVGLSVGVFFNAKQSFVILAFVLISLAITSVIGQRAGACA